VSFCVYCKSALLEGADFCVFCGKHISKQTAQAASPSISVPDASSGTVSGETSFPKTSLSLETLIEPEPVSDGTSGEPFSSPFPPDTPVPQPLPVTSEPPAAQPLPIVTEPPVPQPVYIAPPVYSASAQPEPHTVPEPDLVRETTSPPIPASYTPSFSNVYQPAENKEQPPSPKSRYAVLRSGAYVGSFFLFAIPLVGLLLAIFWACGGCLNYNRRNFARAFLVMLLVGAAFLALSVLALVVLLNYFPGNPVTRFQNELFSLF
jgi:hypothetical protein